MLGLPKTRAVRWASATVFLLTFLRTYVGKFDYRCLWLDFWGEGERVKPHNFGHPPFRRLRGEEGRWEAPIYLLGEFQRRMVHF